MNSSETKEHDISKSSYLPGGTLTSIFGKYANNIIIKQNFKDKLGKWNAIHLQHNDKTIAIITLYRIPNSSATGTRTSLSQYNRSIGK